MLFSDEFFDKWEHLIKEAPKTEVPLECLKKIIIKMYGKRQRTINLDTLRKQGLDIEEIETVLTRTLLELDGQVRDIEFIVDAALVAEIVQPETDKILEKLK
jgi:hypothetical protein